MISFQADLINSFGLAADQGIDGIIVWGNNYQHRNEETCVMIQEYVDTTLGPYVQKILAFTQSCSADLCHSHGRCKKTYTELDGTAVVTRLDDDHNYNAVQAAADYLCVCYEGWSGESCDIPE